MCLNSHFSTFQTEIDEKEALLARHAELEQNLVDTNRALRDQLTQMQSEQRALQQQVNQAQVAAVASPGGGQSAPSAPPTPTGTDAAALAQLKTALRSSKAQVDRQKAQLASQVADMAEVQRRLEAEESARRRLAAELNKEKEARQAAEAEVRLWQQQVQAEKAFSAEVEADLRELRKRANQLASDRDALAVELERHVEASRATEEQLRAASRERDELRALLVAESRRLDRTAEGDLGLRGDGLQRLKSRLAEALAMVGHERDRLLADESSAKGSTVDARRPQHMQAPASAPADPSSTAQARRNVDLNQVSQLASDLDQRLAALSDQRQQRLLTLQSEVEELRASLREAETLNSELAQSLEEETHRRLTLLEQTAANAKVR